MLEISLFKKAIPAPSTLADMEAAGIKRILVTLFAQSRAEALPTLDSLASASGK